jgi:uncharacterized protein RhaS with RHS repeats
VQRFLSEDPIGLKGGLNTFAYAANTPTAYTDPLGFKPSAGFGDGGRGNQCRPYWSRVWDDIALTNRLPGLMAPSGLNVGLRSSEAVAAQLGLRTAGQVMAQEGVSGLLSIDNLLEVVLTHGASTLATGAAFEAGVGVGSMARALFECQ